MTYNTREAWLKRLADWWDNLPIDTFFNSVADELQRLTEERDMWRTMYEESSV